MSQVMNVIRAETFKVLRKRRLYVLAVLFWVLLPVLALIVARVLFANLSGSFANEAGTIDQALQAFASPIGLARLALTGPAYTSPTLYIVAVTLIAALLIGDERSQNMWKTVLVLQPSRWAVMTGKVVVALGALAVLMAGAGVSGFLFGALGTTFLPTEFGGDWLPLVGLYALQAAQLLAPVLLAFLFITLVRSGVLGVVMVLFLPSLLEAIYAVINTISQLQPLNRINALFQALHLQQVWQALPKYFFTANLYAPGRRPAGTWLGQVVGQGDLSDLGPLNSMLGTGLSLGHSALVMAGYSVLFGVILYWWFLRRDVD
ncbi:MAG: ABC transporter permease [Trueperaceae bacterium]|nr:ABC transporter permease [Trueperaceae bacterium]